MSEEIETEFQRDVICPYCGHVHSDSWEFFTNNQECVEADCHSCGKAFHASQHVTVDYSTKKK